VPRAESHYNDVEILLGTFAREISYFLGNVFTFCEISLSLTKFRYFRQFFIFLRHFIILDEISLSKATFHHFYFIFVSSAHFDFQVHNYMKLLNFGDISFFRRNVVVLG
jgi:hypothetical protein